jgi:hypothetical protein
MTQGDVDVDGPPTADVEGPAKAGGPRPTLAKDGVPKSIVKSSKKVGGSRLGDCGSGDGSRPAGIAIEDARVGAGGGVEASSSLLMMRGSMSLLSGINRGLCVIDPGIQVSRARGYAGISGYSYQTRAVSSFSWPSSCRCQLPPELEVKMRTCKIRKK